MDEGRAQHYSDAIRWLEIVRAAYPAERLPEWRAYLDEQIERHKRKYKLRPMLEELHKKSRA